LKNIENPIKKNETKAIGMDLALKKAGKISKRGPKENFLPKPKGWLLYKINFI
jgi:hypothetical protein